MMNKQLVSVNAPNDYTVMQLDSETFALVGTDEGSRDYMEVYHNHNFNGSGTNNLVIDFFGNELDLEFCFTRTLSEEENAFLAAD